MYWYLVKLFFIGTLQFRCIVDCGLYIVGSTMSGFGTMKSDMDMCLMITEDGVCICILYLKHILLNSMYDICGS